MNAYHRPAPTQMPLGRREEHFLWHRDFGHMENGAAGVAQVQAMWPPQGVPS